MNIQELNYFMCIAKHRNLTKAAQELYISQPTLSKYLQKLERELDGKLFSRNGNVYTPTYLGRRYMEYAKKMLAVNQDWQKELLDLNSCKEGELNIAVPLMRSSCMIPSILPVFHERYPGITVNFLEEAYAIQERLLLDDQLDFAIFSEGRPHPKLEYETLANEEVLLMVSPDHPLIPYAQKKDGFRYPWMDLRLFAQEPFILHFPDQTTGRITQELFASYGIHPPVPFRTRSPQTCAFLSLQGLGACVIPETYVKNMKFDAKPACFSIGESGVFRTVSLAFRKGAYLPSYAREFIRIAREQM